VQALQAAPERLPRTDIAKKGNNKLQIREISVSGGFQSPEVRGGKKKKKKNPKISYKKSSFLIQTLQKGQ